MMSSSMQPPDTEPMARPSSRTASMAPGGRGELPHVFTTVTSKMRRPSCSHSQVRLRTSRSTLSMTRNHDEHYTFRVYTSPLQVQGERDNAGRQCAVNENRANDWRVYRAARFDRATARPPGE